MFEGRKNKEGLNGTKSKYFATASKMDEAFLELICKKDFSYITVKESCEKAGVNRSTFYLHYETMWDILMESVQYMHKRFMSNFHGIDSIEQKLLHCPKEELLLITPSYLKPYLSFIRSNRHLYRAAIEKPEIFLTDETYSAMFKSVFNPVLERFNVPKDERDYRMMFYLSGIEAIVSEWIRKDCVDSIDRLTDIIYRCIMKKEDDLF